MGWTLQPMSASGAVLGERAQHLNNPSRRRARSIVRRTERGVPRAHSLDELKIGAFRRRDLVVAVIELTSDESVASRKVAFVCVDLGADFVSRSSALPSL
jgi:hypothetical protein